MLPVRCRVCLVDADDARLCAMDTQLLETYEILTGAKVSVDIEGCTLCYICYWQLQKCQRFSDMARKTEKYIKAHENAMKDNNKTMPNLERLQTLSKITLKSLSLNGFLKDKSPPKKPDKTTLKEYIVKSTKEESIQSEPIKESVQNAATNKGIKNEIATKETIKNEITEGVIKIELISKEEYTETNADIELNLESSQELKEDVKHEVDIGEFYYECDVCKDIFETQQELTAHQSCHPSKPIKEAKKPYCHICKKFLVRLRLHDHMRIHLSEKRYICDFCGNAFRTSAHLKSHFIVHTKEKVYCNICNKGFTQKSSLGKHMLIHTGQSPYFCDVCGKSFKQSGQMKSHIRFTHEGLRPFLCVVCGKKFAGKSHWRRHMDSHDGVKAFSCDKCGIAFSSNGVLTRHKKHHCKKEGRKGAVA